jgi:DNA-directed RNA polymerase subunit beta'
MFGHLPQLTELAMKNIREDQQGFNSVYMMLDSGARVPKNKSSVNWYAWFDKPKNQLLVVVKLLKIQFFLTLKKVFLFLSTLFLLTVLVKVLRIRKNGGCRIPNKNT